MSMSSLEPYGYGGLAGSKADEERWHVRLAADDVKVMTVDQLDDAFRLSIVDGDTEVWKAGMRGWQPLGIVARLDSDSIVGLEKEVTKVGPSPHDATPRVSLAGTPKAPPLRAVANERAEPPPVRTIPPPPKLMVMHTPESARIPSHTPSPRLAAVPPMAPMASREPVRAVPAPSFQPQPVSYAPVARSYAPPTRIGFGFGNTLLVFALVSGTVLSLYRNDVLLDWAKLARVDGTFLKLEARYLGGPPRGTLRELGARTAPVAAPAAVAPATKSESASANGLPRLEPVSRQTAEPAAPASKSPAATSLDALPRDEDPPKTAAPAVPPPRNAPPSHAASIPTHAAPTRAPAHAAPSKHVDAPPPAPRKATRRGDASEYDPLNPAI